MDQDFLKSRFDEEKKAITPLNSVDTTASISIMSKEEEQASRPSLGRIGHMPSFSISCPSSPSPVSSNPPSPPNTPVMTGSKKYHFKMHESEEDDSKEAERELVMEAPAPTVVEFEPVKEPEPEPLFQTERPKPVMSRSFSLKDKFSGLVDQVKEDDNSYEEYIKVAEKQGKTIIETGRKAIDEKPLSPVQKKVSKVLKNFSRFKQ